MIEIIRAKSESERAGAYYVRIQAMAQKYKITLDKEFDRHDGKKCNYILALDDGFPVATCRWFALDDTTVEIGRVVVLPEYRGRKLGGDVVEAAASWIKENGYEKISISAREGFQEFYRKHKFTESNNGVAHHDTFRCVYMERNL